MLCLCCRSKLNRRKLLLVLLVLVLLVLVVASIATTIARLDQIINATIFLPHG
jgi:hypothetical protein